MSLSPRDPSNADATLRYRKAWSAINTLLENGRSLSGRERHCAFLNTGGKRFADVSAASGLDLIDDGRGVALVDWDFDGRNDLWLTNRTAPWVRLLHNRTKNGNHFVAIKPEGRDCNRSAIGARLELHLSGNKARVLHRTLRAGEGFVSQSSKWIIFGLGNDQAIEKLIVRWPGVAEPQTFQGIEVNGHYRVTQNDAEPTAWQPPTEIKPLATKDAEPVESTDRGRIFLASRVPVPPAQYIDLDGNRRALLNENATAPQPPTLINLWATWCAPCLVELKHWKEQKSRFREAGLRVLAISVDVLGDDAEADSADVRRVLDKLQWPFESGLATTELIDMLEVVNRSLVDRHRPLPVPTSFLVDGSGRLVSIYRGPVKVEQILSDAAMLDATPAERLNKAVHFPGRWFSPPPDIGLSTVVKNLLGRDRVDDAHAYLDHHLQLSDAPAPDPSLGEAFYLLANAWRGRHENTKMINAYSQAVRFAPNQPRIQAEFGILLYRRGRIKEATSHLESAVNANPNDINTRRLLVEIMGRTSQADKAIRHLTELVRLDPTDPVTRVYLAESLRNKGRAKEAIGHYREALRLRPDWIPPTNELAWLLATHPDGELRNGAEAVRLAEKVNAATQFRQPAALDTLAAAQAEAGQFGKAVKTAQSAIDLATKSGRLTLADQIRKRLDDYKRKQPHRDAINHDAKK